MSPFLRKVRTSSGATAVQIVSKSGGVRRIVEHLGSAHDETETGGPAGDRAAEDRRLAGPGAAGPGVPGTSPWTNRPGLHHGGVQTLGPAVGRSARGLHPSGAEERHWG